MYLKKGNMYFKKNILLQDKDQKEFFKHYTVMYNCKDTSQKELEHIMSIVDKYYSHVKTIHIHRDYNEKEHVITMLDNTDSIVSILQANIFTN